MEGKKGDSVVPVGEILLRCLLIRHLSVEMVMAASPVEN